MGTSPYVSSWAKRSEVEVLVREHSEPIQNRGAIGNDGISYNLPKAFFHKEYISQNKEHENNQSA